MFIVEAGLMRAALTSGKARMRASALQSQSAANALAIDRR